MKAPSLTQAVDAINALAGAAGSAATLVDIVVDLFDSPHDQSTLKAAYQEAMTRTDAALDRLDAAIDAAEKRR